MPKQNRITPFGEIIATLERGAFMGNRGVLHDADGTIQRTWRLKRWILCVLEFRGRKRQVMTPGRYTELFFLDEATALAAGHRPCAECRHARFMDFCDAWRLGKPDDGKSQRPSATEIDDCLHGQRLASARSKRSVRVPLDELPDGAFVTVEAWGKQAYLVKGKLLLAWSPGGYVECKQRPAAEEVLLLTPTSTMRAIRAGYAPEVHASAGAISTL